MKELAEDWTSCESQNRKVKASPSPANADEQGIVKGEGCFLEYDYFSIPA